MSMRTAVDPLVLCLACPSYSSSLTILQTRTILEPDKPCKWIK